MHQPAIYKIYYNSIETGNNIFEYKDISSLKSLQKKVSRDTGLPIEAIVLVERAPKLLVQDFVIHQSETIENDSQLARIQNMNLKICPTEKDYFKIIYSFWIYHQGIFKLVAPFQDVVPFNEQTGDNPKEPASFYTFDGFPNGVHTRGDGLIHVHPSIAAPHHRNLVQGLDCRLHLFFPVVGIDYTNKNGKPSLIINNHIYLTENVNSKSGHTLIQGCKQKLVCESGNKLAWYLFVWNHFQDFIRTEKPTVYHDNFDKLWLFRPEAVFIFMYIPIQDYTDIPIQIRDKVHLVTLGQIKFYK